jgi:Rhodopirellula transposase DDE domain
MVLQASSRRLPEIARSAINRGEDDLGKGLLADGRVRRPGGRGKPLSESDPTLVVDLKRLVEPATLGSPVQPLLWISKSREKLAHTLKEMGHAISANTVAKLLSTETGFSRQYNRKADEGSKNPDRDAQFAHSGAPKKYGVHHGGKAQMPVRLIAKRPAAVASACIQNPVTLRGGTKANQAIRTAGTIA